MRRPYAGGFTPWSAETLQPRPGNRPIIAARGMRSGFTLFELVLVATIIGILATIVGSRYGSAVANQRADAAARRIVLELGAARNLARTAGAGRLVRFLPNPIRLEILNAVDASNLATGRYEVRLQDEPYRVTGASLNLGGDMEIIFDGYGMPDSGGTITIWVGSKQRTVTVDPDSGQASVQ